MYDLSLPFSMSLNELLLDMFTSLVRFSPFSSLYHSKQILLPLLILECLSQSETKIQMSFHRVFVMSNLWLDTSRPSSPKTPHLFALLPAVSIHTQTFIHTWKPKLTHSQFTLAAHLLLRYFITGMMISFVGERPTLLIAIIEILASEYVIEVL